MVREGSMYPRNSERGSMNRGVMAAKSAEMKSKNGAQKMRVPQCVRSQQADSAIAPILYLQRTIGNQAVQRLFKVGHLQKKLRIGRPIDIYEQEADRVADQVMRMPDNTAISDQPSAISGDDASLQMKAG